MEKQERLRIFIIVSSVFFAVLLIANLVKAKGTVDIKETNRKVNEKNNSIVSSLLIERVSKITFHIVVGLIF